MLIKNLLLKFEKEQDSQIIFSTDNGQKIILPLDLLPQDFDRQKNFYLALDYLPLLSTADNKKDLLNELLHPDGE